MAMTIDMTQVDFWDRAADSKTFTHPLNLAPLAEFLAPDATLLDYGCGQGRLCGQLKLAGYSNLSGVDFSPAMIAKARHSFPDIAFEVLNESGLPIPASTVDCVLLFAVLTCIPDDSAQLAVVEELERVLKPGGILYLSDYLLQSDARNIERYARNASNVGAYGTFVTDDGAFVRHHSGEWIAELFAGFQQIESHHVEIATMNGHRSSCFQCVLRKLG